MNDRRLPDFIRFGREVCGDLAQAERREWWLANGRGGYAAGTIAGTLTRRYHGLLVAPVHPPLGRMLVAAKADAQVTIDGQEVPLFSNRWSGGAVIPAGHTRIESFRLDGRMPVWRYRIGAACIESRIWMEPGRDTTYVAFRLEDADAPARLRVTLLVNARDHHGTTQPREFQPLVAKRRDALQVDLPGPVSLHIRARHGVLEPRGDWYENFDLPVERERGLPDRDSHYCAGVATLDLVPNEWAGVVLSLDEDASPYLQEAMRRFHAHDRAQLRRAAAQNAHLVGAPEWVGQMVLGADSYVFQRRTAEVPDGESVIAGYPWFGDWGRDTMIALPGLTLATGRYDSARRILTTFARYLDQGMLPNVFPGAGESPEYNTVDAALWYVEAWRAYVDTTQDRESLAAHFDALESLVGWHRRGTRFGIAMDPHDALLRAGEPGVQLTWMDAKIGDWVVTPRIGKPVEINALWYNALVAMASFARMLGRPFEPYERLATRVRESFARYRDATTGGLVDVLDGPDGNDTTVRPNQIFAVSLAASPLDARTQAGVVALCGRELFTSYGLRSLAPTHGDYRGQYHGGVWERDSSYHQGPVWAWLLAHFALAEYRVHGDPVAAQRRLEPLRDHLHDAALGNVSEIFDGDVPHAPRGAPCQAWSLACALDAWCRLEQARTSRSIHSLSPIGVAS
ncbi:MAG TPA: amylo-alpha-1,6-glucosidase [Nevskiaceae bacterium]|nr:amylo-alpha-1,6-glucosidase [Nevskiaceae bacterium]